MIAGLKFTTVLTGPQDGRGLNFVAFARSIINLLASSDVVRRTLASTTSPPSLITIATEPCGLIFLAFSCSSFGSGRLDTTTSGPLQGEGDCCLFWALAAISVKPVTRPRSKKIRTNVCFRIAPKLYHTTSPARCKSRLVFVPRRQEPTRAQSLATLRTNSRRPVLS